MMLSDAAPDFAADPRALRKACEDDAVFDDWTEPDYRAIADELGALPEYTLLRVEDDAYKSGGWASFVEIQLAPRGAEPEIQDGYRVTHYASVTLCRIAPLAAFMTVNDEWRALDGTGQAAFLPCVDNMTADCPWDGGIACQTCWLGTGTGFSPPMSDSGRCPTGSRPKPFSAARTKMNHT